MGKVGRNDPCPCGSSKKFKKCCYGKITGEHAISIPERNNLLPLYNKIDYGVPLLDDHFFTRINRIKYLQLK